MCPWDFNYFSVKGLDKNISYDWELVKTTTGYTVTGCFQQFVMTFG